MLEASSTEHKMTACSSIFSKLNLSRLKLFAKPAFTKTLTYKERERSNGNRKIRVKNVNFITADGKSFLLR